MSRLVCDAAEVLVKRREQAFKGVNCIGRLVYHKLVLVVVFLAKFDPDPGALMDWEWLVGIVRLSYGLCKERLRGS